MIFFPQKLWNRVESDQFESVWWDESGTCRVINEELFKKEVLERKTFRIVETKSMKSLIRQLNLYGFHKNRQSVQRSASPPVFLEEENNISLLSKVFQNFHLLAICQTKSCDLESMFIYGAKPEFKLEITND